MSFFDGLKETILAGVDGYVAIETSKNTAVEATAPAPVYAAVEQPEGGVSFLESLTGNRDAMLLGFGLLLAGAVYFRGR